MFFIIKGKGGKLTYLIKKEKKDEDDLQMKKHPFTTGNFMVLLSGVWV